MNYRGDIDGLRAIAVTTVLLYHAGFSWMEGGFVGVDVFFVISGYLITRIIVSEIESTGSFSFVNFYKRRSRRLLPAFAFTLLLTLILGVLLLSPSYLQELAKSSVAAVVSISNIYFWLQSGYFDDSAITKPLLHTWSLSVEEQFYLFWPAILLLCYNFFRSKLQYCVLVVFFVSLFASEYVLSVDSAQAYFLPQYRAYEFALGALVFFLERRFNFSKNVSDICFFAGFAIVVICACSFSEQTAFPGFTALYPAVGAALVIFSGSQSRLTFFISNRFFVKIGVWSYSIYLLHWPIIVYYGYYVFREFYLVEKVFMVVGSILAGFLTYYLIEEPFRKGRVSRCFIPRFAVRISYVLLAFVIFIPSYLILSDDGWAWRVNENRSHFFDDPEAYHNENYGGAGFEANRVIYLGDEESDGVAAIFTGDSYSLQYAGIMDEFLNENSNKAVALFDHGCLIFNDVTRYIQGVEDESCSEEYPKLIEQALMFPDSPIYMAYNWDAYVDLIGVKGGKNPLVFEDEGEFNDLIAEQLTRLISDAGNSRLYYLVGVPEKFSDVVSLSDCMNRPTFFPVNCSMTGDPLNTRLDEFLISFSNKYNNVEYIDPSDALCDNGVCNYLYNGSPINSDGTHLSRVGAAIVADLLIDKFK